MSSAICLAIGVLDRHTFPSLVRRWTPTIFSTSHVRSQPYRYHRVVILRVSRPALVPSCPSHLQLVSSLQQGPGAEDIFCFLLSGPVCRGPSRQAPQHPEQHAVQVSAVSWFQHHPRQSRQCRSLHEGDEHESCYPLRHLCLPESSALSPPSSCRCRSPSLLRVSAAYNLSFSFAAFCEVEMSNSLLITPNEFVTSKFREPPALLHDRQSTLTATMEKPSMRPVRSVNPLCSAVNAAVPRHTHAAVRVHHSLSANLLLLVAFVSREALGSQHCQRDCTHSPDFSQRKVPLRVEPRREPGSISLFQFPLSAVVPFPLYSLAPERGQVLPGIHSICFHHLLSQSFRHPLKCLEFRPRFLPHPTRPHVRTHPLHSRQRLLGTLPLVFPASPPLVQRSFSLGFLVS